MRTKNLTHFGTISLGALIDELKLYDPSWELRFGFGYFYPFGLHSYRGDYSHLAIGHKEYDYESKWPSVGEFLKQLEDAVGKTFEGWKGGYYCMDRTVPVWIDKPGEYSSTAIVDVTEQYDTVYLQVAHVAS